MKASLVLGASLLAVFGACSAGEPGPGLDVDRAMAHVGSMMVLGPRAGDTDTSRRAAAYVSQTIKDTVNEALRQVAGRRAADVRKALDILGRAALGTREDAWR